MSEKRDKKNRSKESSLVTEEEKAPLVEFVEDDEEDQNWSILVHVHGKEFNVSCGEGCQRVKWLGHVGISKWDENDGQGWKRLGVPSSIKQHNKNGRDLDLGGVINETLNNGDQVYVKTSLNPDDTK
jgi:hypothetical protein